MSAVDTSPEAVERLAAQVVRDMLAPQPLADDAAATLRALAAENAKLRAALETIKRGDIIRIRSGDPELGPIDRLGRWAEIATEALGNTP